MENAWQAKITPALASSSSSVASTVQVPSHISNIQLGTNYGYCLQLCDVRQSRFQASAMAQVSSSSSIPDLSPYTGHHDTANPFLSLQHSLNVRVSSRSYPDSLSSATLNSSSNSIPNQRLTHDPREYNGGSGVDVFPLFHPRLLANSQRSGVPVSQIGQDKSFVPQAGSVHIDASGVNFKQKGYMGSSYRMPHGSNLCTSKQSPPGPPFFHHDQQSTVMCSFRVFCMNKSGDLLLSNTGLLAVVCSCHGTYMSISNFCEHSGISNAIPGYVVRMHTGETLAQWRTKYFSKLGIRVPEDSKGWEWPPKEQLSASDNPRCSAPSAEGIKRSVYTDRHDKVLAGYPYVSQNQMSGLSQNDQPANSCNPHSIFSASSSFNPESSLHNMVKDCVNVCPNPNASMLMKKSLCQGGLRDGGQLSSKSCNMVPQIGNLFSHEKISAVSERSGTSSSIELKLGQPSEMCRGLGSSVPEMSSQISYDGPLKIAVQPRINLMKSSPWESGCQQYAQFGTILSSSSITNTLSNLEALDNDLSRHFKLSVRPIGLAASSGAMSIEENTKRPNGNHHFVPWTCHSQHPTSKSALSCIADGTSRPSNTNEPLDKFACVGITNKNSLTGNTKINPCAPSETHFQLYANQMEKMGFFNRYTPENNQHSSVDLKNQLPSMVPNMSKLPEVSGERNGRDRQHVNFISSRKVISPMRFETTSPSENCLLASPPATVDLADHLKTVLPDKKEPFSGPSKVDESLRKIYLVDQAKQDEMNTFYLSDKHRKLQKAGPDLKLGGSFFELMPSERIVGISNNTYKSSLSELTSTSFSPVLSRRYNNNVEASSSTSDNPGANLKKFATHRNGLSSYDEETTEHYDGCHDPQANEVLLQGAGNQAALHGMCKNSSQESELGDTISNRGSNKHSPSNEHIDICESGINVGYAPANKSSLLAEKEMVKGPMHEELKSSVSELRDVPAKIKEVYEVMCINEPVHKIVRRGESGAVQEVSIEVNTAGSSSVYAEDPVCESDQVVDQGSTVSQTSSDPLSGKVQSTKGRFSNSLCNSDSNDCINEHKECKILGKRKVDSHGLVYVKRKRRTKWTTQYTSRAPSVVTLSTFEPPLNRGDQYHLARWRNSTLSSLQTGSRKRYLDMRHDNRTMEHNSDLPDIIAVKKLKHNNSNEAVSCVRLQKVDCSEQEYMQGSAIKPVVCGMYGVISGTENILRLPKIFSLSQVLKTARKCEVEPQLKSVKKSKKFLLPSSSGVLFRGDDRTSPVADCSHRVLRSAQNKQGLDKTKTNPFMSSIVTSVQFKTKVKAVRRRSLYEIFMEGELFSSKHTGNPNNISTLPEQCTYEMKANKKLDHFCGDNSDWSMGLKGQRLFSSDSPCCVCGKSNEETTNCLLECGQCLIKIHQACYGISRFPEGHWYCRPCSTNSEDAICVLCGYGSGAMTRALNCENVVKSLLKAWNVPTESGIKKKPPCSVAFHVDMELSQISTRSMVHNSITVGLFDPTVDKWIHVVCGLWTPGTRCQNIDTMSSFDVSGVSQSKPNIEHFTQVCVICKRRGGSCIRCRVPHCSSWFHPWCAHLKDLLQSEPEGTGNEKIGYYGRCMIHAISLHGQNEELLLGRKESTCARTEGYKGRKQDGKRNKASKGKGRCLVPQEQLNAWLHINRKNLSLKPSLDLSVPVVEHDFKKEYIRYKQTKGWKQLIVYKSGIHSLGLYTSQLIPRGAMVVEYVGEVVGPRVADKREIEYQSGRKLQYKSACYFFRIDKEHIVDATRKGGIARFVNHSCTPNCVAKIISVRNEKKVVFFAQRVIYPGEEITYDYHFNNEDEGEKIPCFCNSRNCRRYLN